VLDVDASQKITFPLSPADSVVDDVTLFTVNFVPVNCVPPNAISLFKFSINAWVLAKPTLLVPIFITLHL